MTARRSNTANVFETTLSVAMAPTDLTATVVATTGGPATPGFLVIEPDKPTTQLEIIYFDGTFTGTTFVTSGIGNRYLTGSAAASGLTHPIGSKVRFSPVAQLFTDLFDYIETMQAKALLTTAGDMPYGISAGVWARLPKGTGLQYLRMNAGATAPEWATGAFVTTATFYTVHTWTIGGAVAVPSGDTDFINPMRVGKNSTETVVLDKVEYQINSGTSATFKMQVNGSDATGFTGISCTTTPATTNPANVTLADTDKLAPVVTAVSGSPVNMTITAWLLHTVTLA